MEFQNLARRRLNARTGLWGLEDWNSGILRGVEAPVRFDSGLVVHDFRILGTGKRDH